MKLLLHTCCAPCLIYPLERLGEKWFEVSGFFYNPNIHPFAEYQNRRQAVENFIKLNNIEVIFPEYNPTEFFQAVHLKKKTADVLCVGHCGLRQQPRLLKRKDLVIFLLPY